MPALVLFKRRWYLSSDALWYPCGWSVIIRAIFLALLLLFLSSLPDSCREDGLRLWVLLLCSTYSVLVALDVITVFISVSGTILDTEHREALALRPVLYTLCLAHLAEVAWLGWGSALVFSGGPVLSCHAPRRVYVLAAVICGWIQVAAFLVYLWMSYDPHGGKGGGDFERLISEFRSRDELYSEAWKRKCELLFCCSSAKRAEADSFESVAPMFASLFRGVDVVASDVVAGFALLESEELSRERARAESSGVAHVSGVPLPLGPADDRSPVDAATLRSLNAFMPYAFAAYGWMLHVFARPATGVCSLVCRGGACLCCFPCLDSVASRKVHSVGDSCAGGNHAAVIAQLHAKVRAGMCELIHTCFENRLYQSPFLVCLDHEERALVVSIRGTLSLVDAVTDITVEEEVLRGVPGLPEGEQGLAHRGMYKNALKIHALLIGSDLIAPYLSRYPGYSLVVTGHSLGAGVAAVLAVLLAPLHPNVHCYAFSPPGAVFDERTARAVAPICTSLVLGNDLVPRASEQAVRTLRDEMLMCMARSKKSKASVLARSALSRRLADSTKLFYGGGSGAEDHRLLGPTPAVESRLALFQHHIRIYDAQRSTRTMLAPGRVAHLSLVRDAGWCSGQDKVYKAVWIDNAALARIVVLPRMFLDHLPDNVAEVLNRVASETTASERSRPPGLSQRI
jgi:sn1-specific diacylglycerol lipase